MVLEVRSLNDRSGQFELAVALIIFSTVKRFKMVRVNDDSHFKNLLYDP